MSHCIQKKIELIILHMHYPTYGLPVVFPVSILKMHFHYIFEDTSWKISDTYKYISDCKVILISDL